MAMAVIGLEKIRLLLEIRVSAPLLGVMTREFAMREVGSGW